MAPTAAVLTQKPSEPKSKPSDYLSTINDPLESIVAVDEQIPTIDYSLLFSDDPEQQPKSLEQLAKACEEYGFFNVINHGIPDSVIENTLKSLDNYFKVEAPENKRKYLKKSRDDRVVYGFNNYAGENREYMKMAVHPQNYCPFEVSYRETYGEYIKGLEEVKIGLARAISKTLGQEETYIEKAFKLESGFDVSAINVYPKPSHAEGCVGLPTHTDAGFCVSLIQDVNGGLRVLSHQGNWINISVPPNAILIQLGDHLEVLTNGKYQSHYHNVVVNNKSQRISVATLHGPALDTFVSPAPEFVDELNPPAYHGLTYREALEKNNNAVIDIQACLAELKI